MKKTHLIELLRTIWVEKVSFFSICLFVAFGIALYCGLVWTINASATVFQNFYNEGNVHSFEVQFPYGASEEDVNQIVKETNSDYAEGIRTTYCTFIKNNERQQVKIVQLTNKIDTYIMQEGELPNSPDEIAVEKYWANNNDIKIGDVITFEPDDDGNSRVINIIKNTDVDNIDLKNFTLKYDAPNGIKKIKNNTYKVTSLVESAAYLNTDSEGYGVNPSSSTPCDCLMFLPESAFDLEAYDGYSSVLLCNNYINSLNTFDDEFYDINYDVATNIENAGKRISDKKHDDIINKAKKIQEKLEQDVDEAEDSIDKIEQIKKLAATGNPLILKQISSIDTSDVPSKSEIDDAKSKVQDFKKFIDEFQYYGSTTSSRTELGTYFMFLTFKQILLQMRISLVLVFVVIGLLVCYSTLSRLVTKQSVQIGIKKANGISLATIRNYYLLFSVFVLLLGFVIALIAGAIPIELIIQETIGKVFVMYKPVVYVNINDFLVIASVYTIVILLTALVCIRKTTKRRAIDLISGVKENSSKNKNRKFLFSKASTLTQTIYNNVFSERKRVFATLIGVLGCTMLLITAFVFRTDILEGFEVQFNDFYHFTHVLYFNPENDNTKNEIIKELSKDKIQYTSVYLERQFADNDDKSYSTKMFVSDAQQPFDNMIKLYRDGENIEINDNNIYIDGAYAKASDLDLNSKLNVYGTDAVVYQLTDLVDFNDYLADVCTYLTKNKYKEIFNSVPDDNCILLNLDNDEIAQNLSDKLMSIDGFYFIKNYKLKSYYEYELMDHITFIMSAIYLGLSILMSLLVLLTIFKVSIDEKKKEIIILKINGYLPKQVKKYVYFDTVFLVIFAIIFGFVFGQISGNVSINGFETYITSCYSGINIPSGLLGAAISAVLALIMGMLSIKDIKTLNVQDLANTK